MPTIQLYQCSVLENYAKWRSAWQLKQVFMTVPTLNQSIVYFKKAVMGEPSLDQRLHCVNATAHVMPLALGRVYAQHLLPSGYKVSYT